MYIFLAFFLPLAYGFTTLEDNPCYQFEDPVCSEPKEMLCPSLVDFSTGCPYGPGTCYESVKSYLSDYDGNPCPNSCYVECDWTKGEIKCPNAPVNGCPGQWNCIAPTKNRFDGSDCTASCPPMCFAEQGEVYCPGPFDSNGCKMTGYCASSYLSPSLTDCPALCHPQCDYYNGEWLCDNGNDENGCHLGAYCMAPTFDKWNNTCDASCPPVCNADLGEVFCPGSIDSYSGCEMPGYCNATCGAFNATGNTGSCFEEDTVYKGKPLKDVNPIRDVESALDCQVLCQENPECEYFTWNSGTGGGNWNKKNKNTCWLKSIQGSIKMNCGKKCSGKTSGAKFC